MSRYWSLEECCWVEYSSTQSEVSTAPEGEAAVGEQIPEQPVAAQREPAFR